MKKLTVLLLSVSFFVGCSEDDEGKALIGVWEGQFQEVSNCINNPDEIRTTNLRCNDITCFRLELNADGTYVYQQGTPVENGTYTGNFSALTLCMDEEGELQCTTFTVEENTSSTLFISTTNEASGCKTAIFFQRPFVEEVSEE